MKLCLHIDTKAYQSKPTGPTIGGIKKRLQSAPPAYVAVEELAQKISMGHSFSPAMMGGTRAADWQGQQVFPVDIDNDDEQTPTLTVKQALQICKENNLPVAFYYHTFNSTKEKPKFRLVFIARKQVNSEKWRKKIMETLTAMLPQSDVACKNADRIFLGTNKRVKMCDSDARFGKEQILTLSHYIPHEAEGPKRKVTVFSSKDTHFSLEVMKKNFDFLHFLENRNGAYRLFDNEARFESCEICGHKNDLVYYQDSNTFHCFSVNGNVGGSIIDYLIHADGLSKEEAIHKFMYEIYPDQEAWNAPLPFEEVKLPAFPLQCLPPVMQNWAKAVAESTGTVQDMAAVAALSMIASTMQGKYRIQVKEDYSEPLNLYILIIARPGERKSAIMQIMTAPIYQYEKDVNAKLQAQIDEQETRLGAIERLIEQCEKKGDVEEVIQLKESYREMEGQKAHYLRLVADDVTPEALTSLLAENGGVLSVISAEGGLFDTLAGRYSGDTAIDTILKAHNGDMIRVDRKGRASEVIDHPALTMLLTAQENVLEGLMQNAIFKSRGLTARILYCKPPSPVGTRILSTPSIPPQLKDEYNQLINSLLSIPAPQENEASALHLSEEAYAALDSFFSWLEPKLVDELVDLEGWAAKLVGAIARIAGLLHCALYADKAENKTVSGAVMKRAIRIGKYFLAHAQNAYAIMGADRSLQGAKMILRKLKLQSEPELSKYQIYRLCRGYFCKTDDVLPALDILVEHGYLRIKTHSELTGGRPKSDSYILNPLYFGK